MIAMLNAAMHGRPSEPGEHVDWSTPDVMSEADWATVLGMPVDEYAGLAPHVIVWVVPNECTCRDPEKAGGNMADGSHWVPCPVHT